MNLEELDGFFTALICGPVTVPPSEYLNEIWDSEEAPFDTIADFENFLNLAMRHWNFIVQELANPDTVFVPLFEVPDGEELPRGNRWALGFHRGMAMRYDDWMEIFEDEDKFAMLLPMLALAHENDPDPKLRTWETPPDEERRKEVIAGICVATRMLYDHFRPHRAHEARRAEATFRRPEPKIGRNDPCYCGSGKKYKKCCGNVTVN